ncbi:MAG: hypothetical protein AB7T49_18445 [Oligoflexales bacterium]
MTILTSCFFFRKRKTGAEENSFAGFFQGPQAGSQIEEQLDELYAIPAAHPPASVRPDPDVVVRKLLLRFRPEGATLAREIGRVEEYRLLLGGASEDFSKPPAEGYDATSLLAGLKVAEEICRGLVSPDPYQHPGWESILPERPSDVNENVTFLAQRILGVPTEDLNAEAISTLETLVNNQADGESLANDHYIPACAALVIDAEAMLL